MNTQVNVTNKSSGIVAYAVPEIGVHRTFNVREIKRNIPVTELEYLVGQAGGKELLYHYLQVSDPEVLEYLINGDAAPEYWLKEADIPSWMEKCSLDEFKDCLDFAPEGTKDLIKKYAVTVPLNDYSKRQAILEQLGYNVSKAIEIAEAAARAEAETDDKKAPAAPAAAAKPTGRRTSTTSIAQPAAATTPIVINTK